MIVVAELLIVVFFGLVLGSFSTALIYRIPKNISWGARRSFCPSCKHLLGPVDLIPLFSWCISLGRCRYCKSGIPIIYPIIEVVSVLLCLFVYICLGLSNEALFIFVAIPFLISLFVIDLKYMILPNQLVLSLLFIGLGRLFYFLFSNISFEYFNIFITYILGGVVFAGLSLLIGFFVGKLLRKKSLGFGDVKFFFVSGIWLGINALPYYFILSGVFAIFYAIIWRIIFKEEIFPFGPALILSLFVMVVFKGYFLT